MADLGHFTVWLWAATAMCQVFLLVVLIARQNVSIHPAFTFYVFMTLAQSGLLFLAITGSGFWSASSWKVGWFTQCLVLAARGFAVAELCKHILGRFRGVWLMARWTIFASGLIALGYALIVGFRKWTLMLTTAELGIELAIAAVIVSLLLFARYYEIEVDQPFRSLAIGLCLYSCVAVLNDTVLEHWLNGYVSLWNKFGMLAFFACLLLWTQALRHSVPQAAADPLLLDRSVYLQVMPEVNGRLRALNEQLIQFWRLEEPRT
jgi:hypothetical protein